MLTEQFVNKPTHVKASTGQLTD